MKFRSEASEPRRLPFVIEKTIHNILFIKTHMQRQDEFDAVILIFTSEDKDKVLLIKTHVQGNDDVDAYGTSTADGGVEFVKFDGNWVWDRTLWSVPIASSSSSISVYIEQSFKEPLFSR